ncbi:MAG: hypothetical protein QOC80_1865 [Frankiaceae bacterium]|jgi:hypothetical protein|nr:hypothetical protein [Frankiaceae bacterium]
MPAGGSLEAWIATSQRAAEDHERKARSLREGIARKQSGLLAERAVGQQLDPLGQQGWRILHDRAVPGSTANIDHVLVGPPGVVVIDTKAHLGRVTIDASSVRVGGWSFGGKVEKLQAYGRAVAACCAGRAPVFNIVCFTEDVGLAAPRVWDQATLLELRQLDAWLHGLPQVLTPRQVWDLAELLEDVFPDRLAPKAAPQPSAPRPTRRPAAPAGPHARRPGNRRPGRRRGSTAAATARRLVALLALLVGLGVAQHVGLDALVPQPSHPNPSAVTAR